jgi:hydroxypyruvate isomerase
MPRFAANLTMLFTEYPLIERFDRAAAAGFKAVEFLFPYAEDVPAIRDSLSRNGLEQILFNLPAGDFAKGDRGIANDPARVPEFQDGVQRALEIAGVLKVPQLNCLAGLSLENVPVDTQLETLRENLAYAAEQAQAAGVRQLIEPLNTIDTPGFIVPTTSAGLDLIDQVGHPNLKLQFDVYHHQRMDGNVTATIEQIIGRISHVQIADSPRRNQPGTGELNYPYILKALDAAGYDGWVSLEYRPLGTTEESLGWLRDWGYWD